MDKTIALEKIQKYMDKIRGGGKTEIYKKKLDYYMTKVLYGGVLEDTQSYQKNERDR